MCVVPAWRLQINNKKTKVMVFGQRGAVRAKVQANGQQLEQVEAFLDLGVLFHQDGRVGWRRAKDRMIREARRALFAVWGLLLRLCGMSVRGMTNMWSARIRPNHE